MSFRFLLKSVIQLTFIFGLINTSFACDKHQHLEASDDGMKMSVSDNGVVISDEGMTMSVSDSGVVISDEKKIASAEEKSNLPVNVMQFVLTDKVEGREPQTILEKFNRNDGKAYAFARLNAKKHTQVTFIWLFEGKERARFTSNVHASKRWRTYSSVRLKPGKWAVRLVAKGEVLAERDFTVE